MSFSEIEAELDKLSSEQLRQLALKSWSAFAAKEARLEPCEERGETEPHRLTALDEALEKAAANPGGYSGAEVRSRLNKWTSK